ncbi:MAG: hypothetical protein ABIY48_09585 [Acidimicrobiales bacterium]
MTTLPLDGAAPTDSTEVGLAAALQERVAERLLALRRRRGAPASLEHRIALVGGLLLAAGAVLVLLGWYGAAHTSRVYLQIPYVISGGLLGVVLAFAGGCAYLASWLTRLVQDQQARTDEAVAAARDTTAALVRIEALLAAGARVGAGATPAAAVPGVPLAELVATPSGKLAHRPTCPTVVGRTDLRPATVGPEGLAPCRMCEAVT